jgi:serine/threonine protein kinase
MFVPDRVIEHLREATDAPDLSGTKYRLGRALGRGGMGAVYAAEDVELGREVAIKVSSAALSASVVERLRREARVVARLEHPGIVPVHDLGTLPDGRVYYVMKLVRGERLDAWAKGKDVRAILRLFQRVCEAVAFAHARGVLHRDLKPENVMVGEFGEALVMDWGIAKELAGAGGTVAADADAVADTIPVEASPDATATGTVMGTPAYMPPEQARGDVKAQGARSDVYGLGAILYSLLAGRPPSTGKSGREVIESAIAGAARPLREIDPSIPRPVESICHRALARDPGDRYASAREMAADVERFLDGERVAAHRETIVEVATRFATRHRVLLSLLGMYLLVRVLLALLAR